MLEMTIFIYPVIFCLIIFVIKSFQLFRDKKILIGSKILITFLNLLLGGVLVFLELIIVLIMMFYLGFDDAGDIPLKRKENIALGVQILVQIIPVLYYFVVSKIYKSYKKNS